MNMNPSVIIPTFNRKRHLIRALKSVLSQTLLPGEVIVVDDHSNFDVKSLLAERYEVKLVRNSRNLGASLSRNTGVELARGNLIAFLDSDDYWEPDKLQKQVTRIEKSDDVGLVYCDQWLVRENGMVVESSKELIRGYVWDHLLSGWTAPNTSTLMIKRDVYEDIGGFDSELSSCQDHDFWMRIGLKGIGVEYCAERLSYFGQDAPDRISLNYERRMKGVDGFLRKWEADIVGSRGKAHFERFRSDYLMKTAFPIFLASLKKGDLRTAFVIYTKYLLSNGEFYEYGKRRAAKIYGKLAKT
jgi:glycosyltransferase involved in cell wall biosynthesis